MYEILFLTGAIGFAVLATLGYVHGHAGSHGGPSHVGGHGHGSVGAHGHAAHNGYPNAAIPSSNIGSTIANWARSAVFLAISPIDVFSLALGAGLVGIVLSNAIGPIPTLIAAVGGAIVFDFVLVKPLMRVIFGFAATPSEGLEGTVSQSAIAQTAFDKTGKGVIAVTLDGQNIQLLAMLDPSEIASGINVLKGDSVTILEVDATRNMCRVSRDLNI